MSTLFHPNIHRALWHKRGSRSSPCLRGSVRYRNRHLPSCRSPFRPLHFWLPGARETSLNKTLNRVTGDPAWWRSRWPTCFLLCSVHCFRESESALPSLCSSLWMESQPDKIIEESRALMSKSLFSRCAKWNKGMAHPRPFTGRNGAWTVSQRRAVYPHLSPALWGLSSWLWSYRSSSAISF